MLAPKPKQGTKPTPAQKPNSSEETQSFVPHPHHHLASYHQKKSEIRESTPESKHSNSPFEKHEKSMNSLYSKYMQHKTYEEHHELGYTADEIKKAV